MSRLIGKWLKIHKDEIGVLLSAVCLIFLVRVSGMLFANYTETAFLKRFGVQYLPIMYMINSLAIFFIMGFMTGLLSRLPGTRLLFRLLLVCGVSVAGSRFAVPLGIDLIYPALFTLKTLYEALLGLLFWNLANDLFNTRQSKRLFPLITAGGVCGDILGGFATPGLIRLISIDNLLLVYLGTTILAAAVVYGIGTRYPTLLIQDTAGGGKKRPRRSLIREIRNALPLMRESVLVKILILMTLFPNVIIPIMNYQFNFAVNEQFATEGGLVTFFGYFRGGMNVLSLMILLFIGRVYGRWGLPVALMFHPCNYLFVFIGFMLRFDIFAAIYARLSTNVIRTTLHKPASDVLMGLIPVTQRALLRPFLRGTVVRVALLLGSGFILVSGSLFHPRYLALVAIPFVIAWVATIVTLKRRYPDILLDLISRNQLDLKSMEAETVGQLFQDRAMRQQLADAFQASRGKNAVWYARLMKSLRFEELDSLIIGALKDHNAHTRKRLIDLLTARAGPAALPALTDAAGSEDVDLVIAALRAVNRLDPSAVLGFEHHAYLTHPSAEVRAHALIGLYQKSAAPHRSMMIDWLHSDRLEDRRAGVIAAGESGDPTFFPHLQAMLGEDTCQALLPEILTAIDSLDIPDRTAIALPYVVHPEPTVRMAALRAIVIDSDAILQEVIRRLGDPSDAIHELAKQKILTSDFQNSRFLVECLSLPQRRIREGIFQVLETLNIKDLDAYRFARAQVGIAYRYLAQAEALGHLDATPELGLLIDHLHQQQKLRVENTLRVLAAQDRSGQMAIITRGIFSTDPRQRANGIEALEGAMDRALSRILVPLIEAGPPADTLSVGRRFFPLDTSSGDASAVFEQLVADEDRVTRLLALSAMGAMPEIETVPEAVGRLADVTGDAPMTRAARHLLTRSQGRVGRLEDNMAKETTISDKILLLKSIEIFEGLTVGELAAVASVCEEADFAEGDIVIREGDPGETMYLIIRGRVTVIKSLGDPDEIELDQIGEGDYFGEMSLFEDIARTASIRTELPSRLLVLHKQEFKEIVREYPQIALEICRVLSSRIRRLHDKIRN